MKLAIDTTKLIKLLIVALAVMVGIVAVAVFIGCHTEAPEQDVWVVYHSGWGEETNRKALSSWFMDQANCGTGWGGGDNELTIHLTAREDSTPRRELLLLAEQARKNLPKGCPITIRVETLEEAIACKEESIASWKRQIQRLRELHGEADK